MGLDPLHLWDQMSIVVKIITVLTIGMSVYMFYVIAERLVTYRAASDQSIRYVQALGEFLRQHKTNEALNAARSMQKSPVAKVMEAGLTALIQGREALKTDGPDDVGNFDLVDSVNRALERVKERETSNLRKGLAYLGTVASATPFIGLLGTVIGILGTFQLLDGGAVTIQAIGWRSGGRYLPLQDDIASVAYWYQALPAAKFPELPDVDYLETAPLPP